MRGFKSLIDVTHQVGRWISCQCLEEVGWTLPVVKTTVDYNYFPSPSMAVSRAILNVAKGATGRLISITSLAMFRDSRPYSLD